MSHTCNQHPQVISNGITRNPDRNISFMPDVAIPAGAVGCLIEHQPTWIDGSPMSNGYHVLFYDVPGFRSVDLWVTADEITQH